MSFNSSFELDKRRVKHGKTTQNIASQCWQFYLGDIFIGDPWTRMAISDVSRSFCQIPMKIIIINTRIRTVGLSDCFKCGTYATTL